MAKLSPQSKLIRQNFIEHLARSYAVDESGIYPCAISGSGRTRNLASLVYEFNAWSKADSTNRRITEAEFAPFMSGLENAIRGGLPRVCGISFKPVGTRTFVDSKGDTLLNTFMPFTPQRPGNYSEVKLILDNYAARLFHQSKDDYKHVLQVCGDIIQNPARRPQHGVIMRGFPGTGKSSLINLLKVALGGRNVWSEANYTPAFKTFSEVLPNNLVVSFDDATAGKNTPEDLKMAVTRSTCNVEIKGKQTVIEREVYSRIWVLSNKHRPFLLPSDDRRFYVTEYLDHFKDLEDSEKYFEKFTEFWQNPENSAGIYWWFRDIDLTDFKPNSCMKTEARNQLIAMSISGADTVIAEFIGDRESNYIDADGVTQTRILPPRLVFLECQLTAHLTLSRIDDLPSDLLRRKLSELGYEETRRIVKGCNDDKQIRMWQKIAKRARSLSVEQIAELTVAFNEENSF